ncbi:TonB-dependent receptor [Hymenobacter actinosclerus]|uniref:TonB dependent receptor n=1 Tax=Hymenobacter actinosclerus TaxID=82805 RepID=A0A1I0E3U4_9BACT|nr:TonB-dependent receptor [Hymenobacter actinosclerus]SET39654.1 hypothetical protein SAMN04487998_1682 [Hymenobacter actinosclerus]
MTHKLLAAAALLTVAVPAFEARAQKTRGTIEDAEIEIVKERVNELPTATRNFEKVKIEAPAKTTTAPAYTYPDFRLPADKLNPTVRVLTIRQEQLPELTGNYLKAGIGNYGTAYGRAYLHNTRSENASYGLDFKHLSSSRGPVDRENSRQSQTSLGLNGETYSGPLVLGAKVNLGRERYNFYGYNRNVIELPKSDSLKQVFKRAGVLVYARNRARDAAFQYDVGLGYNYWSDAFKASESNLYATVRSTYKLTETSQVRVDGDLSFISHKDAVTDTRPFFQVTPAFETTLNRLNLRVGATLGYTGDTITDARQFNVLPALRAAYTVTEDKFVVYAGLGGGLQRVTLYDLSTENPWLAPNVRVADTRRGPTLYFGFDATPARALEVKARVTLSNDRNLYFYNNSALDTTKFDLVYDKKSTQLFNLHGEVVYNAAEQLRLGLKADYNGYNVKTLAQPFHRPKFQSTLFGSYNFYDKLRVGLELYTLSASYGSGRRAGSFPGGSLNREPRLTDTVIDLNLRGDYQLTEQFSVFLMGNNLLGRSNMQYLNYPVKGINVLGGVSYQF